MRAGLFTDDRIVQATVLVHREGGGRVELSKGGMTKDSPFYTASISKLYTHAMVFGLIDRDELCYGTRLAQVLPDIAQGLPCGDVVTIRHMIDQTSGLANYETDRQPGGTVLLEEVLQEDRSVGLDEALRIMKVLPHRFAPGEGGRAYYSDMNAMLLGRIVETVTGQSLEEALETMICQPLGLGSTHYARHDEEPAPVFNGRRRARAHQYLGGQKAQGGVVATNAELMGFTQGFFDGALFDTRHIASPVFRRIQFFPMRYGSGMMRLAVPRLLSPLVPAPEIRGHSGVTGSFAYYCPSRRAFVTGTINQLKRRPYELIYRVLQG